MKNSATVAQLIKERMKAQGITNKQLAENIKNVNVNTIAQLAKGREISYVTFSDIADFLKCSTDYLLGRANSPNNFYNINNNHTTINGTQANVINNAESADELTSEFIRVFKTLDFDDKVSVMQYVRDIKKAPSDDGKKE